MSLRAASAPPRRRRSHIDDVLAAGIARLDLRPADVGMRAPSGSQANRKAPAPEPDLLAYETLDNDSDEEIQDDFLDWEELWQDEEFENVLSKELQEHLADTDKDEEQRLSELASKVEVDELPSENRHVAYPLIVSWLTKHLDLTMYPAGPYPSYEEKEEMLTWYKDQLDMRRLNVVLKTWRSRNGVAGPAPPKFSKEQTAVLERWLSNNARDPFPTDDEKEKLMAESGRTLEQLNVWFTNKRMRKFMLGDEAERVLNLWWTKWAPKEHTKPSNVEFAALKRDITRILHEESVDMDEKYLETQIRGWLSKKRQQER